MEKTLHRLRKKYTLSTTILSGIILLVLFGAFFGMIVVSMNVTVNYTLDVMLENPLPGVPVLDDMGRRCFIFYYDGAHDEFAALAPYVREFNTYGTKKDQIAMEAMNTADGPFETDNMKFYVRARTLESGEILYAVVDTTADARSVASIGMLTAVVYLPGLLGSPLSSYMFSSPALAPVAPAVREEPRVICKPLHELKTPPPAN